MDWYIWARKHFFSKFKLYGDVNNTLLVVSEFEVREKRYGKYVYYGTLQDRTATRRRLFAVYYDIQYTTTTSRCCLQYTI